MGFCLQSWKTLCSSLLDLIDLIDRLLTAGDIESKMIYLAITLGLT